MPDLLPTVGNALEHHYYQPSRFQPHLMVQRALRQLELDEVSIKATWSGAIVTLDIGTDSRQIPAPEPRSLTEAMALLERVRIAVDHASFTPQRARALDYDLVNGALRCLDPHTELMPPEQGKMFQEEIAGEFYGVGAFLKEEEGASCIEHAIPGLPADRAGIEDGDIILGVNGERTAGLDLEQITHRIRGPKGSQVMLTIERKAVAHALDIPIIRDLVQVITMQAFRAGEVGYVRMDEFNGHTARELYRAIRTLQSRGPMKAFVLDLRFNGGGLLDQARLISDFFLGAGSEIVRTVSGDGTTEISRSSSRQLIDVPMAVLISGGTASAAEILGGALQRNNRAVVMGTVSYGKGSVQTVSSLQDGSRLKMTIQEYQLPGGVSIQDVGITPDVLLNLHTVRKDGSIAMRPLAGAREGDDAFALANTHAYAHGATYELGWVGHELDPKELRRSSIASADFIPDQEARLAIDLIGQAVSAPVVASGGTATAKRPEPRSTLLEQLRSPIAQRAAQESAALATALESRTPAIVWGPATEVPAGAMTIAYEGPLTVTAGESAPLTFTISNGSSSDLGRFYGVVSADKASPLWDDQVVFGAVAAKKSTAGTLMFKVPPRLYSGEERFELELHHDGQVAPFAHVPVRLRVGAQPRPHLSYSWRIDNPSGDGQLNPDQAATLHLNLRNDGEGTSLPIDLRIFKDDDPAVQLGENRIKLGPLSKDAAVSVAIPIHVHPAIIHAGDPAPADVRSVKVQIRAEERFDEGIDGRYRATLVSALTIPVHSTLHPQPITPPTVTLLRIQPEGGERVDISVKVADDRLRAITLFLDDDKRELVPASRLGADGVYTAHVTLKPGVNTVRIMAIDQDDEVDVLPLRLWGEGSTAPAQTIN
jgi:carboxyl-terminal processing protease